MLMAPFGAIVNAIRRSPVAATSAHFPKFMTTLQCRPRLHFLSGARSEEHTSELQSQSNLVCRLLLEKKLLQLGTARLQRRREIKPRRLSEKRPWACDHSLCQQDAATHISQPQTQPNNDQRLPYHIVT